jgi:formiminotetrahydrofolate cyclodeaminase
MNKLTDMTCSEFTQTLAAKAPVPGGGGAAAMTGAFGACLCSMAANYTVGKKKYAAYEDELQEVLTETASIRDELLRLTQQDAENFEPLSKAYGIPKDDPGRANALEKATLAALQPPMDMMRTIKRSVELLERMTVIGSVIMMSDVGCGALLAESALKSAALNVFVNTGCLTDRDRAEEIEKEADAILSEYVPRAQKVAETVTSGIRKKK